MTYKEIRTHADVRALITKGNANLGTFGYTDHSDIHGTLVAKQAANLLKEFGYSEHEMELARIAGFLRDIGNAVNRRHHTETGPFLSVKSCAARICLWKTGSLSCPPFPIMTNPQEGLWTRSPPL